MSAASRKPKRTVPQRCELTSVAASHCLAQRNKPLALAGVEAVLASKPVSLTAFHSRRLANWVNETLEKHPIDTIFVFSGQMGQYIPPDYAGQVIVDLCDVDSVKFEDYAKAGERVWLNQREGQLLSQEEERLVHRADTTLLISENEKSVLQTRLRNAAGVRIRAIGNGIDADYFDPAIVTPSVELREGAGPNLIFTGQMDYRPNEQAAIWTIERLLPLLRERFGDASFHIVGRNPTAKLSEYSETPGVRVWGEVADGAALPGRGRSGDSATNNRTGCPKQGAGGDGHGTSGAAHATSSGRYRCRGCSPLVRRRIRPGCNGRSIRRAVAGQG